MSLTVATNGPIIHPRYIISIWSHGGLILAGNTDKSWGETRPSATLSTKIPAQTDTEISGEAGE
jgi:hypothetical protein